MARPPKKTRENFIAGKLDFYATGERGRTVRVWAESGALKVKGFDPLRRKRQQTLFEGDSAALRAKAADVADEAVKQLRVRSAARAEAQEQDYPPPVGVLTIAEACYWYMRGRLPGFPRSLMYGTEKTVRDWWEALPEESRTGIPVARTIAGDLLAFRRLWASKEFAPDRLVNDLEPADAKRFASERVAARQYSPRTMVATIDRISCAFDYVATQYRKRIGLMANPIKGHRVDRTKARIPEYSPEEVRRLQKFVRDTLSGNRLWYWWRIFVYLEVSSSGRRMGSILSLRYDDHDFAANTVRWRAEVAKGKNYGRGDDVRAMTPQHRAAVLWAMEHYPNPHGSEAPVLWKKSDPRCSTLEENICRQVHRLEAEAGVPHVRGRNTHSMRRAVATILADAFGDGVAAEFVGMTVETLRAFNYKQVVPASMAKAAAGVGELLGTGVAGLPLDTEMGAGPKENGKGNGAKESE